jgi:hypothetical protein
MHRGIRYYKKTKTTEVIIDWDWEEKLGEGRGGVIVGKLRWVGLGDRWVEREDGVEATPGLE